ncbi:hypothetical protein ACFFMN_34075 [Planobispora siamensis]|uniref:Major plasmid transfer protein, traa n=1 Tax=Planobispora siamensis TaxID=936338 RepID=A0A8J3SLS3_9ACTN|nr:hypothetical protein [Planobispora siamensis]GIH91918.1 major plasmid transfer protein, traa [Planobispora siamensis]
MRGSTLAAAGEVVELMLEVPQGQVLRYDMPALCSALGVPPDRLTVETDGLRRAIVTIYPSNPLTQVRAVTREDLAMDRHGRIIVGVYHNGRPVRRRLYDPSTGSAQRFLLFGTTGAGKSKALQLQLIAEKINGICSWLGDLKFGQSVPEAKDQVDFHVHTPEGAILMLRSGVAVAHERMRRYSAAGRNSFALGLDPLFHIHLDEINRLLEAGAPYRDEGAYLVKELGRTGRSVGVGAGLAAQAAHLEELGGSDTLRGMFKEGEVTLLRWSASMMRQLVSDGLLPDGAQLMPIPKVLRTVTLRSQFDPDLDEDDDDAPGTQGMGYVLSGPHPTSLMRHFRVGSIAPVAGLDPEILELYGPEEPVHLEEASWKAAGPAYAARHDPEVMAALCQELQEEKEKESKKVIPVGSGRQGAVLLQDRVWTALISAEEPMTADEVREAVLADGGKKVSLGGVRTTLGALVDAGHAIRSAHGLYAPAQ